jgi:cholesterol transport system auxiliary component
MPDIKKVSIVCLGIFLLFSACLNLKQPSQRIAFYTLEYDPPVIAGIGTLPYAIRIDRFSVAPVYDTTQIIYRDQSFVRNAYIYHKWRVNPGNLVTYFLTRDIRHSNLFEAVLPDKGRFDPSFILEGSVDQFVEWDTGVKSSAVLSINVTLIAANEPDIHKKIIFQRSYNATQECKERQPRALAEAMSLAMAHVSGEILEDIYGHLKNAGH